MPAARSDMPRTLIKSTPVMPQTPMASIFQIWDRFVAALGGHRLVAGIVAVQLLATAIAIFIHGFYWDSWAQTEFQSDAYYYLGYAKNGASGEFFTYAGTSPSSGFHPLHWIYLTVAYIITSETEAVFFPVLFLIYAISFLFSAGLVIAMLRHLGVNPVFIVIAVFAMTFTNYVARSADSSLVIPVIMTNYVNMMPTWILTSSLLAVVASTVMVLRTPDSRWWIAIPVSSVVLALARLDYIIVVFPMLLVVVVLLPGWTRARRLVTLFAGAFTGLLWSLVLLAGTGHMLPTSASSKSAISEGLKDGIFGAGSFFASSLQDSLRSNHYAIAVGTIMISAGLLALLALVTRGKRDPIIYAFVGLLVGMSLLVAWHGTASFTGDVGGWYFRPYRPLILVISLFAISRLVDLTFLRRLRFAPIPHIAVAGIATVTVVSQFFAPSAATGNLTSDLTVQDLATQLESIVAEDSVFYDSTDGAFGWFSDYTALHRKGMGNTPEYAAFARSIRVLSRAEMIPRYARYLEENNVDYVVTGTDEHVGSQVTHCLERAQSVAVAELFEDDKFAASYAVTAESWLDFQGCVVREFDSS
jgi:hypothetical protein